MQAAAPRARDETGTAVERCAAAGADGTEVVVRIPGRLCGSAGVIVGLVSAVMVRFGPPVVADFLLATAFMLCACAWSLADGALVRRSAELDQWHADYQARRLGQ